MTSVGVYRGSMAYKEGQSMPAKPTLHHPLQTKYNQGTNTTKAAEREIKRCQLWKHACMSDWLVEILTR